MGRIPWRGRIVIALAGASAALALGFFLSCTPGSEITAAESDVVATLYDQHFAFGGVGTYAMPDSIVHFTGDPDQANSKLLSRDYDQQIIAQVTARLDGLGWTRVTDPDSADMIVLLGATASVGVSTYYPWYGYWGWYYPYPPAGGWYYPYPVVSYDYTLGTLVILMSDPASFNPGADTYEVRWVAAINGVLDDTATNKQARLTRGIDQAFKQSPYL